RVPAPITRPKPDGWHVPRCDAERKLFARAGQVPSSSEEALLVALIPATFLSFLHIDENNKPQKKAQVSLRAAIQHDSVRKYVPACPLTCGNWPASAPPAPFPLA